MFAATIYKLYDFYKDGVTIQAEQINLLIIGNVIAFVVAAFAIRSFINALTKYGLKVYGYYRIAIGLLIVILIFMDVDLKLVD